MADDELDIAVRGGLVPSHFSLTMSVDAGAAVRRVVREFRAACLAEPGWFGLREDEDEALAKLVDALEPPDGDEPGGALAVA